MEIFAGTAELTKAVVRRGLVAARPIEIREGLDFLDPQLNKELMGRAAAGLLGWTHLAPDCKSWSLAARGWGTRRKECPVNDRAGLLPFAEGGRDGLALTPSELDGNAQIAATLELCLVQHAAGRFWSLEQPREAWFLVRQTRWGRRLIECPGVLETPVDQCAYGLRHPTSGLPVRKPTILVSNSSCLAAVERACACRTLHGRYENTTMGAGYPAALAEAIAEAILQALRCAPS